jgi:hypothetical protein
MPALLGKAGIVDDPRLDRSGPLDRWQNQLTHLGQHPIIGPRRVANETQQRLMLRRHPRRRRHRRHRFDALAVARQQQPKTIVPQRHRPVSMADRVNKTRDLRRKARFTLVTG